MAHIVRPARTPSIGRDAKTVDILLMMILVIGIVSISSSIVSEAFEDTRLLTAKLDLEHFATSIAENQAGGQSRGVASSLRINTIAEIGRDPWGNPYHYQIIKSDPQDTKTEAKIIVWSAGPNGKFESDVRLVGGQSDGFVADDLGYIFEGHKK